MASETASIQLKIGVMVPLSIVAARRKRIDGEFVFCSRNCAEQFDEHPTRHLESQKK